MPKVSFCKRLHGLTVATALVVALVASGAARPAGAQLACYTKSPYLMDNCGNPTASQQDYEFRYANGGYFAYADGTSYLVSCRANDLTIYNVANPLAPAALVSGVHIPWDWNTIDTGGDTHGPYKSHLWDVATAGNFRYGLVSMGEYGWDFLRISGGTRGFLGKGFHPTQVLDSNEYVSAALFTEGAATYAAAQKLDQASIASGDASIKIYPIGTATEITAGLGSANMTPVAQVNDLASFATPMNNTKLWVVNFSGSRLLLARRTSTLQPALLIANISNPGNPQPYYPAIQNDSRLFGGAWAVDEGHSMVWVADKTKYLVHAYKIVQTLGIPGLAYQYSVTWWGTGTETLAGATTLSVAGNLLVAASLKKVGYLSLAGGQATRLPEESSYTDVSLLPPPVCSNPNFNRSVNKMCAFQVALQHYVLRSMIVAADIVGVNGSCISTTPLPDFTVTGGSASATCPDGTAYDQADAGFPGDTFTIKDASAGVWDTATLEIKNPQGATVQSSQITNYGQAVTWTPATNAAPGDYTVTLSIAGGEPPSKTKVISLCGDPQAALAISQGSAQMLVGESVNVSAAATAGHPNGYTFYVVPTGQQLAGNGSTLAQAYTLPAKNTYTFGVVAHFDFAATDTGCSGVPGGYLVTNHDSCATVAVIAGYGVSSFVVLQNGQQIAPPQGGSLMVNQPTVLKFTGKVASNRAPNFVWNIPNVAPHLSCQFTAWPYTDSTCGIPANTWTAGNPFTMNMDLQVCEGVGAGIQNCTGGTIADTITAVPAVTVTPTLNSITFNANKTFANIGEAITITLDQIIPATTGYSSLLIDFGGMSCDGVRQDSVTCRNILNQYICTAGTQVATFSYAASEAGTTRNVTITGTLSGGGTVQSASRPITIGTSGTCPCPTVTAAISGPSSTSVGQTVPFSAAASAGGHPITSWSWTFGDGGTATGQSVTHSWSSIGTYQVRVTATSDCGSTDIDTSTIVVGGGGGGNLTITPTPATVDPGAQVTFTFSPGVSRSGDQVSFNFGDGTPTQAVTYMSIFCSPTSPCDSITHTYPQAGTYTVTAGGTAGGLSVSGSTTVTVQNTCALPSAPMAAFTWLPSVVRVGEVVQFRDASTGGPTSWSWSFGGPGVAGSTSAQTFATPLAGLTVTPNDATPSAGQQVTFTFSPGVSVASDSVTFNFGDGSATQAVTYLPNFCSIASPCDTIGHTFSQAGTYTVTASGRAGGTAGLSGTTQVVVSGGGSTFTITANPSSAAVGQNVIFTLAPTVSQSGDTITVSFGDGQQYTVGYPCTLGACGAVHAYANAGIYTVSASGTAGGAPVSGSTMVVIGGGGGGGTLTITPSPANPTVGQNVIFVLSPTVSQSGDTMTIAFGDGQQYTVSYPCPLGACGAVHAYSAAGTYTVSASGTAGGAAVSGSTTVVVGGGGGGGGTSTAQNPTFTYTEAGTYTVTLTATNCKGSNQTAQQIVVLGPCTQTAAPVADFTWGPLGELPGYPEQQQPYAGQQVTFTDNSTNEPDQWHWYDFQEDMVDSTVTTRTFTHTWSQPGDKNVRMTAHNCSGLWSSSEILKTVHIYEDVRHVTADFSWSPSAPSTGAQVTFTAAQGPAYGDPTGFTWTFDDGSTQTGSSVTYAFECGGSRRVALTATRGGTTGTVTKSIPVDGPSCGPESVMGVDAAKLQGLNDTNWRADVRIYNPSVFSSLVTVEFLPVGWDNFSRSGSFRTVAPRETWVLDDILQWAQNLAVIGRDIKKTALRVTYRTDDDVPPIITIRTYNLRPDGSKYGQINPGVNVVPGTTPSLQWITGLRNNGVTDGFRTNYSIVNLRGEPGGIGGITFTIFDEAGAPLGSKAFGLAPFGYIQDSIKALFGPAFENIGTFSLKVEVPTGGDVQVYASVMDNHTGDPVLIPATPPSDSPIYLPAMAHLSGEAATVWRTDLQLTNPDANGPHTWEIRYTPKGTSLSVATRTIALAATSSFYVDDVVSWVYNGTLAPDAQTSGIVRIAPVDASSVYPAVAARSYNLTATGTFGQGIPALWAAKGVSAPDPTRLVLTGMSSEDIARTNFGFVNLSETQGANFVVYFYDDRGNPLNPSGTDGQPKPYTYAIGPGTWDQDKLENRFKNGFKVSLPNNLPAITAEIRVTDGGPGFAYATVIDNKTGDPNFIPAQFTP